MSIQTPNDTNKNKNKTIKTATKKKLAGEKKGRNNDEIDKWNEKKKRKEKWN